MDDEKFALMLKARVAVREAHERAGQRVLPGEGFFYDRINDSAIPWAPERRERPRTPPSPYSPAEAELLAHAASYGFHFGDPEALAVVKLADAMPAADRCPACQALEVALVSTGAARRGEPIPCDEPGCPGTMA